MMERRARETSGWNKQAGHEEVQPDVGTLTSLSLMRPRDKCHWGLVGRRSAPICGLRWRWHLTVPQYFSRQGDYALMIGSTEYSGVQFDVPRKSSLHLSRHCVGYGTVAATSLIVEYFYLT